MTELGACVRGLQVAFAWAVSIEPEEGTQLLLKLGLLDPALEYALDSGAFAQAFQLCQTPAAQHKMPDCHLKYAMHLEDEGTCTPPHISMCSNHVCVSGCVCVCVCICMLKEATAALCTIHCGLDPLQPSSPVGGLDCSYQNYTAIKSAHNSQDMKQAMGIRVQSKRCHDLIKADTSWK